MRRTIWSTASLLSWKVATLIACFKSQPLILYNCEQGSSYCQLDKRGTGKEFDFDARKSISKISFKSNMVSGEFKKKLLDTYLFHVSCQRCLAAIQTCRCNGSVLSIVPRRWRWTRAFRCLSVELLHVLDLLSASLVAIVANILHLMVLLSWMVWFLGFQYVLLTLHISLAFLQRGVLLLDLRDSICGKLSACLLLVIGQNGHKLVELLLRGHAWHLIAKVLAPSQTVRT